MRAGAVLGLALVGAAALSGSARGGDLGSVEGRVSIVLEGVRLADAGPLVAYLEPLERDPKTLNGIAEVPTINQKNAQFEPDFLAISAGQTVAMPNDDVIFHNVFSYSRPNDFDLGLYPQGVNRRVKFRYPGFVRIYCSIHESMNGGLFVAPTPLFARVAASGEFRISDVPPGRYRLRTWGQRLPSATVEVSVEPGRPTSVAVPIGQPGTFGNARVEE
jgi:plastocyanin